MFEVSDIRGVNAICLLRLNQSITSSDLHRNNKGEK
jgi:hypothetical protein